VVNILWAAMILMGIGFAALQGNGELVTSTLFAQAASGLAVALNLLALLTVWFGLSRVAERAGLLNSLARLLTPLLRPLFPGLPHGHPSLSAIAMNIAANFLGLANAATPFGLKAMEEMQRLNPRPDTVTPAMITFLALNSACATLLPATAVALRAQAGAPEPARIIGPAAAASGAAMVFVLLVDGFLRRRAH